MANTSRLSIQLCIYLINVLNEVLHGFSVDFVQTLGTTQGRVFEMFQRLKTACESEGLSLELLSAADARLLLRCSEVCLAEIDMEEFSTRLGETAETAFNVNRQLSNYLEEVSPKHPSSNS